MNAFDVLSLLTGTGSPAGLLGYIDPGTGSYIFQLIVAGVLSFVMMFRNVRIFVRAKLAAIFGRKRD